MNRRNGAIFIVFAALVAGAALVVYAEQDPSPPAGAGGGGTTEAAKDKTAPEPLKEDSLPPTNPPAREQTPPASAGGKDVIYDPSTLPNPVQRMLGEIGHAAQSGDIERMRSVLETNELKPMVASAHVDDPIAHWKKDSADGDGRDVLAAMLNILSAGGVLAGKDKSQMYVWPYFAEMDLKTLTPAQEVELYRAVPPDVAVAMKKSGKYNYYRLGISPAGVWHYFLQ
ncbi:MAG: hypothetical protein ACR2J1_03655 [Methyloceanibacter sp.]|uniref:hypothetical protein n=1 Tax=Methyloceanibacter sp. TaxID=1965321 RepID=UPI003D9ABBB0